MAESTKEEGKRFWVDKKGNKVPYYYVSEEDRARDRCARKVKKRVEKLRDTVEEAKGDIVELINDYLAEVADRFDEDWKGNATIRGFSDLFKIEVNVSERIEFDEKLQIAKQKIDNCINDWAQNSSRKIQQLVNKAFKVDKKGLVNKRMLLGLRNLDIDDEEWNEAMDIIADSVNVVDSKEYYRFFKREDRKEGYDPINLNFSRISIGDEDED